MLSWSHLGNTSSIQSPNFFIIKLKIDSIHIHTLLYILIQGLKSNFPSAVWFSFHFFLERRSTRTKNEVKDEVEGIACPYQDRLRNDAFSMHLHSPDYINSCTLLLNLLYISLSPTNSCFHYAFSDEQLAQVYCRLVIKFKSILTFQLNFLHTVICPFSFMKRISRWIPNAHTIKNTFSGIPGCHGND